MIKSRNAYSEASTLAEVKLDPCHPVRLGIALNLSNFYYQMIQDHHKGIAQTRLAISLAKDKIEEYDEKLYKEAKYLLRVLEQNFEEWVSKATPEELEGIELF
jgi:14-3-3 protein epsilon